MTATSETSEKGLINERYAKKDDLSDAVLVVENKDLYVSKQVSKQL